MYELENEICLVTIASPVKQNLALQDVDECGIPETLAVIHNSFINVIPILNRRRRARYLSITQGDRREKESITQLKWITLNEECLFVVLSTMGLQIYDVQVNEVSYFHCCREGGDRLQYTMGICVIDNMLCIGTSLGAIWIFKPNENNSNFNVVGKYYGHDEPIVTLDSCDQYLVSCSEKNVYIWKMGRHEMEIVRRIDVPGIFEPASAIKVSASQIILGFESGEFCIFDIIDKKTCIKNVAHTLKIVDIDFSPLTYNILTASLDAFLKVWLYTQPTGLVTCLFSVSSDIGPLCGAQFLNLKCTGFAVVTIDKVEIRFYKQKNIKDDSADKEKETFDSFFTESLLQND